MYGSVIGVDNLVTAYKLYLLSSHFSSMFSLCLQTVLGLGHEVHTYVREWVWGGVGRWVKWIV